MTGDTKDGGDLSDSGGTITYTDKGITVILDRPDSPRIAGALTLLTDELNNTPTRLPGDHRTLTYKVAEASQITTKTKKPTSGGLSLEAFRGAGTLWMSWLSILG
ncbi:hypothetical protein ART_0551 [Arthrobacter sp. PAMC 25486]|uniref:hypothetical protein n=1 Tax=Arthrobacter sp. PAMC 25486 TaxID=1494608 RepID=UPI000535C950|nr:hypothetical protein [Arthrobacter sp. PAMC 25486]AIY00150.1 hypothetical protein ART_0551 [Arthrobacter sp. PAMC 25486]